MASFSTRIALLAAVAISATVRAQTIDGVALSAERFRPASTAAGILDVESAAVGEHLQWNVALWTGYALNPLVAYTGAGRTAIVGHRWGANLTANVALFNSLELIADLPLLLVQGRDDDALSSAVTFPSLASAGLGDLRLAPKVRALRASEHFVDVSLIGGLTLPTGFPAADAYVGEGQVTFTPELAVSRHFRDGALQGLSLATNLAARFRPLHRDILSTTIGDEYVYRFGVGYLLTSLLALPLELDLSVSGATSVQTPFAGTSPLEALAGATYAVTPSVDLFGGVGMGVVSAIAVPDARVFAGLRYTATTSTPAVDRAPIEAADTDADGLLDDADRCQDQPEDHNGFEDKDGCPDGSRLDVDGDGVVGDADACPTVAGTADARGCALPDTDSDGVRDVADACPAVAGTVDNAGCPRPDQDGDGVLDAADACVDVAGPVAGCPDQDGDGVADAVDACPDEAGAAAVVDTSTRGCPAKPALARLGAGKLELRENVLFATGSSTISAASYPLLDQVVALLQSRPDIARLRIEGHTDNAGKPKRNDALSRRRADSVLAYLVAHGVVGTRLIAEGFGAAQPLADDASEAGREKNRRVEFIIVEVSGGAR